MPRTSKTLQKEQIDAIQLSLDQLSPDNGWKQYRCELVTPMFGGGVKAGVVDEQMPVRASAIRGQLRFWWRIACGPFSSDKEMFQREREIWGGIGDKEAVASKVEIRVVAKAIEDNQLQRSSRVAQNAIKYAFGPATINGEANWLAAGYDFTICMRYDASVAKDVETALRWFACFGGIGARTRRGFGALQVSALIAVSQEEVHDVGGRLAFQVSALIAVSQEEVHDVGGRLAFQVSALIAVSQEEVHDVGGRLAFQATEKGASYSAWDSALEALHKFRQGAGTGRRAGGQRPGRSFWPEPDQLRRFTNKNLMGRHMPEHPAGNVFPRAAFGLPITFNFRNPEEPRKMELLPQGGAERMASPLILRPYWDGSKWWSCALLLPGWEKALSQKLTFKNAGFEPKSWPADLTARQKLTTTIRPMNKNGEPRALDPLSAFMHYFAEAN
ncbi:type III-B CRISPR module RAMP protein Cmr1 [Rheinheimera sediminis]|uniref:type III-B CRISPR module RAMP protein Cmr1 n=1 Tax=Rheinheimera sp. YQF-1 TaxID=2499626 RepID=UPI000FD8610F|nr:type III-B CRISPR module RAMP protein Cmr1 [Rheinheimera sp. YQF-1]RVT47823.1 type III-B CRISPR module RAMP protein Cmr1 [Rheinheimera sp. YQF-1]